MENENEAVEQVEETAVEQEPQGTEIDWKKEARKWERLAKKNKPAPDSTGDDVRQQLDELTKEVADLKSERDKLQHQNDLRTWADEVAAATHVPASVLRGSTKEEMQQHAQALVAAGFTGKSVPDGGEPGGTPGITREQIEATKNAVDRIRLRAQNLDLYK